MFYNPGVGVTDHLGLTDEANITLQVADVNEYPPVFQYSRYIGSVPENYDGWYFNHQLIHLIIML